MSLPEVCCQSCTLYAPGLHYIPSPVCEVVQTLQLCTDRDPRDVVGDLSVCLDGMQVDPETFASAERERGKEPHTNTSQLYQVDHSYNFRTETMYKCAEFFYFSY